MQTHLERKDGRDKVRESECNLFFGRCMCWGGRMLSFSFFLSFSSTLVRSAYVAEKESAWVVFPLSLRSRKSLASFSL